MRVIVATKIQTDNFNALVLELTVSSDFVVPEKQFLEKLHHIGQPCFELNDDYICHPLMIIRALKTVRKRKKSHPL